MYSVGTATPTLVSEDHTQMWLLSDTDGSKRGVLYPWASLGEAEINVDLLDKMERKIVSLVINSPGVTLVTKRPHPLYSLVYFKNLTLCHRSPFCLSSSVCFRRLVS